MKDWTIKRRNGDTILYVIKDSTGERFYEGDMVWHEEYNEIGPIRFDGSLTGTKYFDDWYEGYVRADSGIYPISEISALVQRPLEAKEELSMMLLL